LSRRVSKERDKINNLNDKVDKCKDHIDDSEIEDEGV
jgi:hypothetical protein